MQQESQTQSSEWTADADIIYQVHIMPGSIPAYWVWELIVMQDICRMTMLHGETTHLIVTQPLRHTLLLARSTL